MDDCCGTCWKKLVIAFNTIFLICGLTLLGAGIYFQLTLEGFSAILGNENINPGTLLIIIGGITVIIAFFGCVGACCENSCGACMLKTFGSLVALLLLVEVILVVVVYFKQPAIEEHMKGTIQEYNTNNATENAGITKIWDTMQQNYECCGVVHPSDWKSVLPKSVPDSCCKEKTDGCGENARKSPDNEDIFAKGCYVKLSEDSVLLGSVGGVLLGIQLLAIIVSCCMACRRKDSEDGYELTNMQD